MATRVDLLVRLTATAVLIPAGYVAPMSVIDNPINRDVKTQLAV